jgi:hypothetical protein
MKCRWVWEFIPGPCWLWNVMWTIASVLLSCVAQWIVIDEFVLFMHRVGETWVKKSLIQLMKPVVCLVMGKAGQCRLFLFSLFHLEEGHQLLTEAVLPRKLSHMALLLHSLLWTGPIVEVHITLGVVMSMFRKWTLFIVGEFRVKSCKSESD